MRANTFTYLWNSPGSSLRKILSHLIFSLDRIKHQRPSPQWLTNSHGFNLVHGSTANSPALEGLQDEESLDPEDSFCRDVQVESLCIFVLGV